MRMRVLVPMTRVFVFEMRVEAAVGLVRFPRVDGRLGLGVLVRIHVVLVCMRQGGRRKRI